MTVFELRRPNGLTRPDARALLLSAAANLAAERSTAFWVLDNIEASQMRRDELILHAAGIEAVFDHRQSHEEPLLWIVDAVLWALEQAETGADGLSRSSRFGDPCPESAKPSYSPSGELAGFTFRSSWNGPLQYGRVGSVRKPGCRGGCESEGPPRQADWPANRFTRYAVKQSSRQQVTAGDEPPEGFFSGDNSQMSFCCRKGLADSLRRGQ